MSTEIDDEKEIIFIALSNQILLCLDILEKSNSEEEEKEIYHHLLERCEEIIDKYNISEKDIDIPISEPNF